MDYRKLITERWSCRAYLSEPVPDEAITERVGRPLALRSPRRSA
jgi:hypothetical protein